MNKIMVRTLVGERAVKLMGTMVVIMPILQLSLMAMHVLMLVFVDTDKGIALYR